MRRVFLMRIIGTLLAAAQVGCSVTPRFQETARRERAAQAAEAAALRHPSGVSMSTFVRARSAAVYSGVSRVQTVSREGKTMLVASADERSSTGGVGFGAVIAPDGYILTAAHCIEPEPVWAVVMSGSAQALPARVVWRGEEGTDIALLHVDAPTPEYFAWSRDQATGRILVAGLGSQSRPTLAMGELVGGGAHTSETNPCASATLFMVRAPVMPGDSGGPLMTPSGELLGVIVDGYGHGAEPRGTAVRPNTLCLQAAIEADRER